MYRIAVLTDHIETGQQFVNQVIRFCSENGLFPQVGLYNNQEDFFDEILQFIPTGVILALSGVAGLNVADHLRSLLPNCKLIWCSDLDFSLHAFRLRAEYFILEPVSEENLREGLFIWMEKDNLLRQRRY